MGRIWDWVRYGDKFVAVPSQAGAASFFFDALR